MSNNFFTIQATLPEKKLDFGSAKPFTTVSFEQRYNTYVKHVLEHAKVDGMWLEFGVSTGETTERYVASMPEASKPLFGFDSFEGIPEDWASHTKGAFSTNGAVPNIPGTEMVVGWFDATLPGFMAEHDFPISVLVIDCDVYSSTKTILDNCKNNIVPGTVILFDEFHNGDGIYHDWEKHEYKAFMEFVAEKNVKYEWVAYVQNGEQAACVITEIS